MNWQQTVRVVPEAPVELLRETFPDHSWLAARHQRGAFHDVWAADQEVVARITRSSYAAERLSQRTAVLDLVAPLGLPVRTPRLLSEVVRWDERRAVVLIERLDGAQCDDKSFGGKGCLEQVGATLNALHGVPTEPLESLLLPVRDWCGGDQWPEIVREMLPLLPAEHRSRADGAVAEVLGLEEAQVLSHGDLTRFNFLWDTSSRPALIDWDHACVAGASLDIACLMGSLAEPALVALAGEDTVARARVQKRSFPLQVAAAGLLHGDDPLRATGLRNFVTRPDPA